MWRLIVPVFVAASLGGGCGQNTVECSEGAASGNTCVPLTPAQKAALGFGEIVPPGAVEPLTHQTCSLHGNIATCQEIDGRGLAISGRFAVAAGSPYALTPICPTPQHPIRAKSVFCSG